MNSPNQLWWQKYRKRPPARLNFELVVRKSIFKTLREYVDQCGIAGVKDIWRPECTLPHRLLYTSVFIMSCGTFFYLMTWTKGQTFSSPFIVTQESSTYPIGSIDFPAVALCNVNRISKKALERLSSKFYENLTSLYWRDMTVEYIAEYLWQHGKLIDFTYAADMMTYPFEEEFRTNEDSQMIVELMKQLAPSCDEMLLRCAWAGELADCRKLFRVRRTVYGHCCVFNYALAYHSAGSTNRTAYTQVKRQYHKGPIHGLHVVADPLIDDYAYPIKTTEGFDLFLFDPMNFPDPIGGRLIHRVLSANQASYLEIKSVKQTTAPEVKHYPITTRNCLFRDELANTFGNMYSYSTCIVNCRIRTVKTLCKCIPYFLPVSLESGPICTLEQLRCLNKYKEKLLYQYPYGAENLLGLDMEVEDALDCRECLPDCEFTQHHSKAFKVPVSLAMSTHINLDRKAYISKFTEDFNLTNKCILSVFQVTRDGTLNRLDVISYWFEILSNIGGFAGILLGFSIVCVMEAIYYLIIRFPLVLYANYKKYY